MSFSVIIHILTAFLQTHGQLDFAGIATLFSVFAITGLVPIPRTALCLASGAIYGMLAVLVLLPATTLCSVVAFLLARYLFSDPLYRYAMAHRRLKAVLSAVDQEGWKIIALMRFASAMPTFMQNYLFGLTRIGLWTYIWSSIVFTIPQVCLYVYIGTLGRAGLMSGAGHRSEVLFGGLAAVCMLTVVTIITRKVRRALGETAGPV